MMGETVVTYDEQLDVDSSAFETAFWNRHERILYMKFWNGSVVSYTSFGNQDWDRFQNAMSKGAYYNSQIKTNWAFKGNQVTTPVSFRGRQPITANDLNSNSVELNHSAESPVNITVNIFFSGDPEAIAKAVERLAPSIKAINSMGRM
jgi:hypothetical protein